MKDNVGFLLMVIVLISVLIHAQSKKTMGQNQYTNQLIHETSPYLLQHAHNPVNWMPWGDKALQKANAENKLLLISIGYSACHWCHVMEHESFEDVEVADFMNEWFVNIKVDREERPDVDQIYMAAVQLMNQQGGWPLNVIALPDGRPIWGGTYFPKRSWINALKQISAFYVNNPQQTHEYAERLSKGISESSLIPISNPAEDISIKDLKKAIGTWKPLFDMIEGGRKGAPKFMMPNNLQFLLRWAHQQNDRETENFIKTSLTKMALGGIYDQVGGGFARYSTDTHWKVPHFEKMLYDNGQLLSVYSQAWQKFKNPLYKEVVEETIEYLEREMLSPEFGFYSALDADSEGEEGKFYVWKKTELEKLLGDDFNLFSDYYNVNPQGYWEHDNYILLRKQSDETFAKKKKISEVELKSKVQKWKSILYSERMKRVRPGLDDKILTSWNALVISGLVDAYKAIGTKKYLLLAERNARFIKENLTNKNGTLNHSFKNGISKIDGFLEDYALYIGALISLYEVTGDENYLNDANLLTQKSFNLFFDKEKTIFYFNVDSGKLITRTIEIHDNVLPGSNSVMANNLFKLGHFYGDTSYLETAKQMLLNVVKNLDQYPAAFSNWMQLMLSLVDNHYEMVIVGENAQKISNELQKNYLPNIVFSFSEEESSLSLLKGRYKKEETLIYVCQNNVCQLPVKSAKEALKLIQTE